MALTSSSFHQNLSDQLPNNQTDIKPAQSTMSNANAISKSTQLSGTHLNGCVCSACCAPKSSPDVAGLKGLSGSTGELWSQPGGKGTPITLNYSFVDGFFDHVRIRGGSPDDVKASVEKALSVYTQYAPINFVEVKDQGADTNTVRNKYVGIEPGDPQLRFHAYYQNGDGGVFGTTWLPSKTHAIGGDVFMDYETWDSTADFVEDFMHELGHALGLEHSSNRDAIMYPSTWDRFSSLEGADLLPDDIRTIQSAYGAGKGSVKPLGGAPIPPNPQPNPQPNPPDVIGPDFNGDGKTDILWQNTSTNQVEAWLMDGAKRQSSRQIGTLPQGFEVRSVGDFNSDGQTDLILQGPKGAVTAWFLNGAQRSSSESIFSSLYDTNEEVRGAADFDGDGNTDLLVRNAATGENEIWMMNGTDWRENVALPTRQDQDWKVGGTADFNKDGSVDILWRNQTTGQNQVWYLDKGARIGSADLPRLTNPDQTVAGVGDYNKDGNVDVLWRNQATGENTVWLMNGVQRTHSQSLSTRTDTAWQTDVSVDLAQTPAPTPTPTPTPNSVVPTDQFDQEVLRLVNQERAQRGLKLLALSEKLDKAADLHSQDMAKNNYFEHTGLNGSNTGDRIEQAGYTNWNRWGENIDWYRGTAAEVVQSWMNSAGHRDNILDRNFTHMGLGYAYNDNIQGDYRWTQVFAAGDPNPGQYSPERMVINPSPTPAPTPTPTPPSNTNPIITGTDRADKLVGDSQNQTIRGKKGHDIIQGNAGNDKLFGNQGRDELLGGAGDDELYGGWHSDKLVGGDGDDHLQGAWDSRPHEKDVLTGGNGGDLFVLGVKGKTLYDDGNSKWIGGKDYALITDFNAGEGDVIQLSADFNYRLGSSPKGVEQGQGLFIDNSAIQKKDELIAVIQGSSKLNLNSSAVRLV